MPVKEAVERKPLANKQIAGTVVGNWEKTFRPKDLGVESSATRPRVKTTVELLVQEPGSLFVAPEKAKRTPNTYSMPSGDE